VKRGTGGIALGDTQKLKCNSVDCTSAVPFDKSKSSVSFSCHVRDMVRLRLVISNNNIPKSLTEATTFKPVPSRE